jgi:hypothetical protein
MKEIRNMDGWKVLLAGVVFLLAMPSAHANNREAQERAAKKACLVGDSKKGTEILADLYVDTNDPNYIYNQGRCFEQNGEDEKAIHRFEEYLRKKTLTPAETEAVRKRIDNLQAAVDRRAKLLQAAPAPAPAPESTPVRTAASAIPASAAPAPEPLVITPDAPTPKPQETQPASGGPKQGWWLGRKWAWVAAGSTVLLGAGALVADLSMYSKIHSSKSYPCGPDKYCYGESDANAINVRMLTAEVLAGTAAAAAVTTVLLFIFEGQPVTVAPVAVGMTGAMARVEF